VRNITEAYELDAMKSLSQLYREWEGCTRCPLGIRRDQVGTRMVRGEGRLRGIMLVGEGPGETEESLGQPFVGKSGYLLREVLEALGMLDLVYITNVVACRSCQHKIDKDSKPVFRRRGKAPPAPVWEDIPPPKASVDACWPRFHQELYIVDPIVIVAMGNPAVEALFGHPVSITRDRGKPETVSVDGVGYEASLTEKKGAWIRSYQKGGGFVLPTVRAQVDYTVIPTVHPAYVSRKATDASKDSPFKQFSEDMRLAVKVYERYLLEVYGTTPSGDSDAEVPNGSQDEEEDVGGGTGS
jgi:uracil-DNA glycosylase